MPPKKKSKKKGGKAKKAKPSGPPVPPLHELWTLETLHSQYEAVLGKVSSLKAEKAQLKDTISELKNDHQIIYEKFKEDFEAQNDKINGLVKDAKENEERRVKGEEANKAKMDELGKFAHSAQHTVTKISAEWKAKLVLLREAETAVVRNAQLEIDNSQLNHSIIALKEELRKRERQLFVVSKSRLGESSEVVDRYEFGSNQEGEMDIVGERTPDISVAMSPLILEAMKQFPMSDVVQREGVVILATLNSTLDDCTLLATFHGFKIVTSGLRRFLRDMPMQAAGAKLLWKMASLSSNFFKEADAAGIVAMALHVMRLNSHQRQRRLVFNYIRLLKEMTKGHIMAEYYGLDDFFRSLEFKRDSHTNEDLKKMFPRVDKKRGKFQAMKQEEEAKAKLAKLKKLEAIKAAKASSLPSIMPSKKKAAVTASKRRSILLLGNDDEEEAPDKKGKVMLGSKSSGALSAVRFGLSQTAKVRLQQTTFFVSRGLPDAVSRALRAHEQEAGRVNHEVMCLVEELGVNFERTLDIPA